MADANSNVIDLNSQSARAYYATARTPNKQGIVVAYRGLRSPKEMVEDSLKRIEMYSAALEVFAVHPELRAMCERAAAWMTDYYPAEKPDRILLDECFQHAFDSYFATSSPRAKRNEPLKAFVTVFMQHAVLMVKYSVGCRASRTSYDRNIWSFLSEPMHDWLDARNPKDIEFKAVDRLKYSVSTQLALTFLTCRVADFSTLSILDDGATK